MQAVVVLLDEPGLLPVSGGAAMLPLGPQRLIDVTLGWLERSGLSEVSQPAQTAPVAFDALPPPFVAVHLLLFCLLCFAAQVYLVAASQAELLTEHLKQAGWAGGGRGMAVHVLAAPNCQTEGEALRFVEEQDVIKGDFLLVSGAMATNVDTRPAMHAHMARRAANRQAIMTVVLHSHAARSAAAAAAPSNDRCLAVVDPSNQQLLRMEQRMHVGHGVLGTHFLGERNCIAVSIFAYAMLGASFCTRALVRENL